MKKKINIKFWISILIPFIVLGFLYFKFALIVPPDGSVYFLYTKILDGVSPLSTWNLTRGPSFPIILFIIKHLFGSNSTGLLIGFFIFYIIFCLFGILILRKILEKYNNKGNFIYWLLYFMLIVFNPLMIGYSHTLLTEAIAPAFIMFTIYLVYKWKDVNWHDGKIKTIIYTIAFSIITVFMWFLKQPYMPVIIFILGIATVLIGIMYKSKKVFFEKALSVMFVLVFLFISILTWNSILSHNGVENASDRNSSFISTGILQGLNAYYRMIPEKDFCSIDYIESSNMTEKEKKEIIELSESNSDWCKHIKVLDMFDKNYNVIGQTYFFFEGQSPSVLDTSKFLMNTTFRNPLKIMSAYYRNYMSMINIYETTLISHELGYMPGNKISLKAEHENAELGLQAFRQSVTCWWQYSGWENAINEREDVQYMENFASNTKYDKDLTDLIFKVTPFYLVLFKIIFLLSLPLAMCCFVGFLKDKKNDIYFLATILFTSSFLHVLFHAVFGAIIDRYAIVVFPLVLLGEILLLVPKKEIKNICLEEIKMKNEKRKSNKTIFVIPAYNESKNISNVIKDIKKNMPQADIVVTNDYSSDNTREIVESLGVTCLNVPFNMGYAMAVQTGIKYAYENDYDYVVQFDADGQHLASEVNKLVKKMKETDANIIIGSRFIEKSDYKHPFFRKIGTKMFQTIIKIFCQKDITDPTSGFQLLDREVIARYAKIGKYPEFPDANLIIEMLLNGYKIEEVPVKMKENADGKSMHGGIIKPIKYMISVTYSIIFIILRGRKVKTEDK